MEESNSLRDIQTKIKKLVEYNDQLSDAKKSIQDELLEANKSLSKIKKNITNEVEGYKSEKIHWSLYDATSLIDLIRYYKSNPKSFLDSFYSSIPTYTREDHSFWPDFKTIEEAVKNIQEKWSFTFMRNIDTFTLMQEHKQRIRLKKEKLLIIIPSLESFLDSYEIVSHIKHVHELRIDEIDRVIKAIAIALKNLRYKRYPLIQEEKLIIEVERHRRERDKQARVSAILGKARSTANRVKKDLMWALDSEDWICPYCYQNKDLSNAEADHIHPIVKGGQTTPQNMVYICYYCNRNKRDLTLRQFCKKSNYDYAAVCSRLESDGKDV